MNVKFTKPPLKVAIPLLIIGLLALAFGCYVYFFESRGFVKTEAVIYQIDEEFTGYDADDQAEYDYDVYVHYTVNGERYSEKSDYYEGSYEVGKSITIYYNPANPHEIHGDSQNVGIYLMVVGAALAAFGAYCVVTREKD